MPLNKQPDPKLLLPPDVENPITVERLGELKAAATIKAHDQAVCCGLLGASDHIRCLALPSTRLRQLLQQFQMMRVSKCGQSQGELCPYICYTWLTR